jgi:hypothetical protein
MIGLATRGYLRRLAPTVFVGAGPGISGVAELVPGISGASQDVVPAPVITEAEAQTPLVVGAVAPEAPSPGAPSISGGSVLVPIIRKAEET